MIELPEDLQRYRETFICPNCGEEVAELVDDVLLGDMMWKGCENCVGSCDHCGEKVFNNELRDAYVYYHETWSKGRVCDYCWELYEDDPATYDCICEQDPRMDLFDKLHKIFEP